MPIKANTQQKYARARCYVITRQHSLINGAWLIKPHVSGQTEFWVTNKYYFTIFLNIYEYEIPNYSLRVIWFTYVIYCVKGT